MNKKIPRVKFLNQVEVPRLAQMLSEKAMMMSDWQSRNPPDITIPLGYIWENQ